MPLPELGRWVIAGLLTLALAWAAISDIRTRMIPNWTVLVVIGLFVPWAMLQWGSWDLLALTAGATALAIGIALYALGVVGAGDAKLFAAVALFAGWGHLLALGLATALVGGVIAIISLAARPRRALLMVTLRGKGDFGRGIPYGVAIAIAGALVVWAGLLNLHAFQGVFCRVTYLPSSAAARPYNSGQENTKNTRTGSATSTSNQSRHPPLERLVAAECGGPMNTHIRR